MSSPSCELKLRMLAQQNAALVTALAGPPPATFLWMDRQVVQGDIGKISDGRSCVTVRRISTSRSFAANQGGPVQNLSQVRLQIDCVSYNAEQARQVAALVTSFMRTISLLDPGEFGSPQTAPRQNPSWLLNERAGMMPNLQPPAYVETQDWRVWNNEAIP